MSDRLKNSLLLVLAVTIVAGSVWGVQEHQTRAVDRSLEQAKGVQGMLTAMLDQETGLRGFLQTGEPSFLDPYRAGRSVLRREIRRVRRNAGSLDADARRLIDRAEVVSHMWEDEADRAVLAARGHGVRPVPLREVLRRKRLMDAFRGVHVALVDEVERARAADAGFAQRLSVSVVLFLAGVFGLGGWLLVGRPAERARRARHREHVRRDRQAQFARAMQVMEGEHEAHDLVRRHLERNLGGAKVTVLQRNNSADRLEPTAGQSAMAPQLADALLDAGPRSCLAVRLSSTQRSGHGADELLACELCGKTGTERTLCTPLVVSGEVMGSVLVAHDRPLPGDAERIVDDTVALAAPVLANMRNLAIAETRASTDALTGLANRRAVQDTIHRMVAQAARGASELAVLAIDVDHFKQVNDRYGHDRGDEVLAAVAQALAATLRASDFVGRQGGEEFIALLPETGLQGACEVAEKLRAAVEALETLPGAQRVTASFGVAVLPADGGDATTLVRSADRALYAAKAAGRNRVETAGAAVMSSQTAA